MPKTTDNSTPRHWGNSRGGVPVSGTPPESYPLSETSIELDERQLLLYDTDAPEDPPPPPPPQEPKEAPATWLSLPRKSQLMVLVLCRFSEPLAQNSVASYLFYYLASFHPPHKPPPSAATISRQAGILASSFALAQCLTGLLWGRLSDKIGRKPCLLLGLAGTTVTVIGFGFSGNLAAALTFRILGGGLNGNVGILRTMLTEVVVEKKFHSRAFLILPMCFNVGIIIGPTIGGLLADPAATYPGLFGKVAWMRRWPYALPNLVNAVLLCVSMLLGFLFLEETLDSKRYRNRTDVGLRLGRAITSFAKRACGYLKRDDRGEYMPVQVLDDDLDEESAHPTPTSKCKHPPPPSPPPTFRKIFTKNVVSALIAFTILPLHNATFTHLWPIFLSTPRDPHTHGALTFTGGLGLPAHTVGLATSLIGGIGIVLQLFLYPPLQARFGLIRSFRFSYALFAPSYLLVPFLARIPSTSGPHEPASGTLLWCGVTGVLLLQVVARTFAFPGSVILLTNSVEKRSVLGTVHGVGTSLTSASRAVGPVVGGVLYAVSLEKGVVGCVFWGMAGVGVVGAWWGWFLKEGRGLVDDAEDTEDEDGS